MESTNLNIILKEEFIEMTLNLVTKSMYTFKGIECYWMNKKAKYPKLPATVEPIL